MVVTVSHTHNHTDTTDIIVTVTVSDTQFMFVGSVVPFPTEQFVTSLASVMKCMCYSYIITNRNRTASTVRVSECRPLRLRLVSSCLHCMSTFLVAYPKKLKLI